MDFINAFCKYMCYYTLSGNDEDRNYETNIIYNLNSCIKILGLQIQNNKTGATY